MSADRRRSCGFTLVEVLVALAIVAFGLIAVFGQMNQSATAASRLRDKTLASWVAHNEIAKLRLSGEYPGVSTRSDDIEMANQRWQFEIKISETDGNYLRRADVSVALASSPERPIATVVGFIAQPHSGQIPSTTAWTRLTGAEQFDANPQDPSKDKDPGQNPAENPTQNPSQDPNQDSDKDPNQSPQDPGASQ